MIADASSLMTTKSIPLQVPVYSELISSPISIYQFREVPLGPHVHNNSSQLEEHKVFDYLEYTETTVVLSVQEQTHLTEQLVTGKDCCVTTSLALNCKLVVSIVICPS